MLNLEQVRLQKEPDLGTAAAKPKTITSNTSATSSKINLADNNRSSSSNSEDIVNLDDIDLEDLVGGSIATVVVVPAKASAALVQEELQTATSLVETLQPPNASAAIQPDSVNVVGKKRPISMMASAEEPTQTGDMLGSIASLNTPLYPFASFSC